ncbi:MAG: cell division protein FtsA [Bacteroidales bacterium]|nr:cell division protein FtsA [Bacteroidales bacterium]
MFDDYVAILDIGTTKIVSLVGRKDPNGNLQILGYGEETSAGVTRGLVLNINEASEAIEKAVNKAKEQSGIDFKKVFVGIAGQHIYSHQNSHSIVNTESDEISEELVKKLTDEVYNVATNPGEVILHVFPQEYYVDGQIVNNPVGSMGKQLSGRFHISIGKEKSIKIIEKSIARVGLQVIKIILEPVASAEAVLTAEEKEAGVVLIDIGGGTTDMVIYKDNVIRHTAVVPFGGNSITDDLHKGCSILVKQAEDLKKQYGSAVADLVSDIQSATVQGIAGREAREISFKAIAEIIQARVLEIIDTINFELKNSNYYDEIAGGITLTGGGSLLKHINRLVEFRTGLETKIASPENYIYSDQEKFKNPKYSTAIGLLLKGIDYMKQLEKMQGPKKIVVEDIIEEEIETTTEIKENNIKSTTKNQDKKQENNKKTGILTKLKNFFIEEDESSEV